VQHFKPSGSNVEKVDVAITPPACTFPKNATCCSKTVVEIDPLIDDILRSKEIATCVFVGDVLNHEEEISNISVGAGHVQ
jgi:hypothetical protein